MLKPFCSLPVIVDKASFFRRETARCKISFFSLRVCLLVVSVTFLCSVCFYCCNCFFWFLRDFVCFCLHCSVYSKKVFSSRVITSATAVQSFFAQSKFTILNSKRILYRESMYVLHCQELTSLLVEFLAQSFARHVLFRR